MDWVWKILNNYGDDVSVIVCCNDVDVLVGGESVV